MTTLRTFDDRDKLVPVYDWVRANGTSDGLGTEREFNHWKAEGTIPDGVTLGRVLCYEPRALDERRARAWAAHPLPPRQ